MVGRLVKWYFGWRKTPIIHTMKYKYNPIKKKNVVMGLFVPTVNGNGFVLFIHEIYLIIERL